MANFHQTDVVFESFVEGIGKNVSVTYQPRKNKTGIKKIVLSDCKKTFPKKQITIKIKNENLSFPMKTTTKNAFFRCAATHNHLETYNCS